HMKRVTKRRHEGRRPRRPRSHTGSAADGDAQSPDSTARLAVGNNPSANRHFGPLKCRVFFACPHWPLGTRLNPPRAVFGTSRKLPRAPFRALGNRPATAAQLLNPLPLSYQAARQHALAPCFDSLRSARDAASGLAREAAAPISALRSTGEQLAHERRNHLRQPASSATLTALDRQRAHGKLPAQ